MTVTVLLTTTLVGATSAFLPITPIEPYLVGIVTTTTEAPVPLGIAAAAGQAAGKLLIFLLVRGVVSSAFLRRLIPRHVRRAGDPSPRSHRRVRAVLGALDRPGHATPVLFLSATTGLPPLVVTSVYLARGRMPAALFTLTCLLGRSIRFVTIALAGHATIAEGS